MSTGPSHGEDMLRLALLTIRGVADATKETVTAIESLTQSLSEINGQVNSERRSKDGRG